MPRHVEACRGMRILAQLPTTTEYLGRYKLLPTLYVHFVTPYIYL
jgi:hypothetical protein